MSLLEFSVDRRVDRPGYRDLGRGHLSLRDYESFEVQMTCAVDGWQGATDLREHMERYFAVGDFPPPRNQREHLNQLSEMDELRERADGTRRVTITREMDPMERGFRDIRHTMPIEVEEQIVVPHEVPCDLCEGRGRLASAPVAITGVVGWTR